MLNLKKKIRNKTNSQLSNLEYFFSFLTQCNPSSRLPRMRSDSTQGTLHDYLLNFLVTLGF